VEVLNCRLLLGEGTLALTGASACLTVTIWNGTLNSQTNERRVSQCTVEDKG